MISRLVPTELLLIFDAADEFLELRRRDSARKIVSFHNVGVKAHKCRARSHLSCHSNKFPYTRLETKPIQGRTREG